MSAEAGYVNGYVCPDCTGRIYTQNADEGTIPMMLGCRGTKGCRGLMQSTMGELPPPEFHPLHIRFEWFKPDDLSGYDPLMQDHLRAGGLDLREITCTVNDERCAHEPTGTPQ